MTALEFLEYLIAVRLPSELRIQQSELEILKGLLLKEQNK